MQIKAELERAREEQRLNIPAKRILEKIQSIPEDVDKLQRRWFWELLQNASDYNDEVEVIVELGHDKIVFRHNGRPFRPLDAENLIAPDSGKDDAESRSMDLIGQFGTGFISTHVLASRITVNGILKSEEVEDLYSSFQFDLDRSGFTDKQRLKKAISSSSLQLSDNTKEVQFVEGEFNTAFTYHIEEALPGIGRGQAVQPGLEYVFDMLPYTLAFMPKVKKVTILNHDTSYVSYRKRCFVQDRESDDFIVRIDTENSVDGSTSVIERKFVVKNQGDASVIVCLKGDRIQPFPDNVTKLFCALPMIGTEDFASPVVINSAKFVPRTERNGIRLSSNSEANRNIVVDAVVAYGRLVQDLIARGVGGFQHISSWPSFSGEYHEKHWFKEHVVDEIKRHLIDAPIVLTAKGRVSLSVAQIPFLKGDESTEQQRLDFYHVCALFNPELVPVEEDFESWYVNLDFKVFPQCRYSLKKVLEEVEGLGSIDQLQDRVLDAKTWLLRLVSLTVNIDDALLDKYKVLPNQVGDFQRRRDNVYYDDSLDEGLIEIFDVASGSRYRELLLDPLFNELDVLGQDKKKSEVDLAKEVDDVFSSFSEEARGGERFQRGLRLIFKWFSECGKSESELKDLFKWFSSKKSQLFLETFDDDHRDKVLAIAQSGKLESLAHMASSDLSDQDIKRIANNLDELDALAKVLDQVPSGMVKLLQFAEMLREDEEEFQFKKRVGEQVELVFLDALLSAGIEAEVIHDGKGAQDFCILNRRNDKAYFIELKSYARSSQAPLRLAVSQAKKAVSHAESYSLVTIERPGNPTMITQGYIKENARSSDSLNEFVSQALEEYQTLMSIARRARLHVTFREAIRVNLDRQSVLATAQDFQTLVHRISQVIG